MAKIDTDTTNTARTTLTTALHDNTGEAQRRATRPSPDVADRLKAIDWDFRNANASDSLHSVHSYPAKFIAEIPRALIRELRPPVGTFILDPFCGCGTTLLEAQTAGYPAIGVDLNPIACLIARVKTRPLPDRLFLTAQDIATTAARQKTPAIPHIPNLDHWFPKDVQRAVASLVAQIDHLPSSDLQDHLRLALSSILVRVSNQESDTRYAAIEKDVSRQMVFEQFLVASRRLAGAKAQLPFPAPHVEVIQRDILEVTPNDIARPIGLAITSPPYPNAYEYWLYHKYRMWWLGHDPQAVKEKEIGARAHYFKKNHPTTDDFRRQMNCVLSLLWKVIVPGGFACIVVGRSRIHGRDVDNAALIIEQALAVGFHATVRLQRTIAPARKSFNLAHARIATEDVLVFARPN